MAEKTEFPKQIYIHVEPGTGGGDGSYLSLAEDEAASIEDDGPTLVATYELKVVRKLAKIVKEL